MDKGVALVVFASAWWVAVAMAFLAIRMGRIETHREWMIRGYVLTFAFVTVRVLLDMSIWKPLGDAGYPTAVWLAWVVPLGFTEIALQLNRLASRR